MAGVSILMFVVLIALLYNALASVPDLARFWNALAGQRTKVIFSVLAFPIFLVLSFFMQRQMDHSKLILDGKGIRMEYPPFPFIAILGLRSRRLLWDEITQIAYLPSFMVVQVRGERKLPLFKTNLGPRRRRITTCRTYL